MPLAQIINDGLWRCLCPIASAYLAPRSTQRIVRLSIRPRWHCQSRRPSTRSHVNTNGTLQRPRCQAVHTGGRRSDQDKSLFWQTSPQEHNQPVTREVTAANLYEELRTWSTRAEYSNVRSLVERLVVDHGEKPNIRLYHALILGNAHHQHGSPAEVKRFLKEMADEGIMPDSAIYHAVLRVLAIHPDYLLRQHILSSLRQRWFSLTQDGYHDLVAGLIRDRQLELALDKLEEMQNQSIKVHSWLYDMIMYTLCTISEFDAVLKLMHHRLASAELHISGTLWYHILDTASLALHHPATNLAYNARVETSYLNPPTGILNNVLATAARHGDTRLATSVLHTLSRRSSNPIQLHHYESLIETYMAASDLRTALTLLTTMTSAGHTPTKATTRPIYRHLLISRTRPTYALNILHHLKTHENRTIPTAALNLIIETYLAHDLHPLALETYTSLSKYLTTPQHPDVETFNLLLRGCHQRPREWGKKQAMFLASEMVALKIPPDALTYDRLILACLRCREVDAALAYFGEMREKGWWPRGGTVEFLAKVAAWDCDGRVWDLEGGVGKEGGGGEAEGGMGKEGGGRIVEGGMGRGKLEELVGLYWGGRWRSGEEWERVPWWNGPGVKGGGEGRRRKRRVEGQARG